MPLVGERDAGLRRGLLSGRAQASSSSIIRDLLDWTRRPGMLSLAGGLPAAELLPVDRVGAAVDAVLARQGRVALQYGPTAGEAALREQVAPGRADDVVITTGSQQSLDLLARVLLDPGDVVAVEASSYLGALSAFRAAGAGLLPVPSDAGGLDPDRLEDALVAGARPKVVYVVPNFANPTGATLGVARRRHLAALADRYGFVLVEDDPYGRLAFTEQQRPSVAELTPLGVRLGTASKVLAPGLRVGWVVLPGWLRDPVVRAKQSVDLHTSSLDQLVVAEVLADDGFLAGHLEQLQRVYGRRCRALVGALQVSPHFEVDAPEGGMFAWARLRNDALTADELLTAALATEVAFVPGSAFDADPAVVAGRHRLRLCFATLAEEELTEAVRRLDAATEALEVPVRSS